MPLLEEFDAANTKVYCCIGCIGCVGCVGCVGCMVVLVVLVVLAVWLCCHSQFYVLVC
jgi:hypothetical protein